MLELSFHDKHATGIKLMSTPKRNNAYYSKKLLQMKIFPLLSVEHDLSHLLICPVTSLNDYSPVKPAWSVDINLGDDESDSNIDDVKGNNRTF